MKVKYIKNRNIETPNVPFPIHNPREYLHIGKTYYVYGMMLYNGELKYLIVGEYEKLEGDEFRTPPSWEPAELFEVVDAKIPQEWYFKRSIEVVSKEKLNDPLSATWGYKELALDVSHGDGLMERETKDIKIFLKRKHEIDEWIERNSE